MKNKSILLLLLLIIVFLAVSCSRESSRIIKKDTIEVYDKEDNLILETKDRKTLKYFSKLIGNTTDNMKKDDFPLKKLPDDAEISYEYKFITKRKDGNQIVIDFLVYENYPYVTMKGIPFVTPMTWEVSEEENIKLQNPELNIK